MGATCLSNGAPSHAYPRPGHAGRMILLFARNHRSAMSHATTEGIPWAERVYVASEDTIRELGATRGIPRRYFGRFDEHPRWRQIQDALYTADLFEAAR